MHKPILSHIVPFTHKTNSLFILLWGGLRLPLGGLGLPWHGLAGDAGVGPGWPGPGGGLGVAGSGWGWPGGGLGRFYYPGTIRELSGNYQGFCVSFLGWLAWAWLGLGEAGWGWVGLARAGLGWLGLAGAEIKS